MQIGQFIYLDKVLRIKAHSFNFSINPHVSPGTKALSEKLHFQRSYRSTNSYMNIYISRFYLISGFPLPLDPDGQLRGDCPVLPGHLRAGQLCRQPRSGFDKALTTCKCVPC